MQVFGIIRMIFGMSGFTVDVVPLIKNLKTDKYLLKEKNLRKLSS